jgi:hypothetical protein
MRETFTGHLNALSQAKRLQMIDVVFTSLPIFHMGTYLLPKTVIDQIDKYKNIVFGKGHTSMQKGPPKAAWKLSVCQKEDRVC